jgi:hypothetical protein
VGAFARARDLIEACFLEGFQKVTDFLWHRLACSSTEPSYKYTPHVSDNVSAIMSCILTSGLVTN